MEPAVYESLASLQIRMCPEVVSCGEWTDLAPGPRQLCSECSLGETERTGFPP